MSQIENPFPEFSFSTIRADISNLQLSLEDCLKQAGIVIAKQRQVRILNLACGRSDETGILMKILAPSAEACELIGVDIRAREIDEANTRWNKITDGNAQFLVHDGTKLDQITELDQGFDYAFMRHQNFWNGDLTWHKIYDQALHLLKPNGLLIITSYFDKEHLLAVKAIQSLGAQLVLTWQNPRSNIVEQRIRKTTDRHIAIFRLPSLKAPNLPFVEQSTKG